MIRSPVTRGIQVILALAAGASHGTAWANPISGALGETKPIIDARWRYEWVDQTGVKDTANAEVMRLRLGAETGKAWGTALLVEGEFVTPLSTRYRADNAVPRNTVYPVVADPEAYELNRLQLTNTSIDNTTISLGRQRINLDDQRFVGNVGWRMNEQTFDALRMISKPGGSPLTLDFTYADRVNRVYGPDSPQGHWKGDIGLGNVAYQFGLGKLTGFAYLLHFGALPNRDFPGLTAAQATPLNPARLSTQTLGGRFAGGKSVGKIKLAYAASYAKQKDYGDNPTGGFSNDYYLGELGATFRQWSVGGGIETLGGDGKRGFSTPLATLHKFQGWTDKFLTTPANGIEDKYGSIAYTTKSLTPFETVSLAYVYHDYKSARLDFDYGHESNVQLSAKWSRVTFLVKYGDYKIHTPIQAIAGNAASLLNNTKKFWTEVDFLW